MLWLANRIIDAANRRGGSDIKVDGHQVSSASMVSPLSPASRGCTANSHLFRVHRDALERRRQRRTENLRRLVEQDEGFGLWAVVGTPPNVAVYDYTNDEQVPHAFLAGGASIWGAGVVDDHPWTIGWQPAYSSEAAIFADYLAANHPGSTIAVLVQNDDFGADYLDAFEAAVDGSDLEIVAVQSYEVSDPTVDQQVVELAASDADVFFNVTVSRFAAQAITKIGELSWDPLHIVISASSSPASVLEPAGLDNAEGIITARYTKDPNDPTWAEDPAIIEYTEHLATYAPDVDPLDPTAVYGFAQGLSMQWVLEHSVPVRSCFMDTLQNLPGVEIPLLLPDVRLTTGPDDGFPMETMQIIQFVDGAFQPIDDQLPMKATPPVVEE